MNVTVIASPTFHHPPRSDRCRPDQLKGTPAEQIAEYAGRICYDSFGQGRDSGSFAANILEHNHVNVLYHATFVLEITGVSRNLTHELVRHHVGFSPSQRSTRYCDERIATVIDHPAMGDLEEWDLDLFKKWKTFSESWRGLYAAAIAHCEARGKDRKTARAAAARYLPNGVETELVWSGNLAAFRSMIQRRLDEAADLEFRLLAKKMLEVLTPYAPKYLSDLAIPGDLVDP